MFTGSTIYSSTKVFLNLTLVSNFQCNVGKTIKFDASRGFRAFLCHLIKYSEIRRKPLECRSRPIVGRRFAFHEKRLKGVTVEQKPIILIPLFCYVISDLFFLIVSLFSSRSPQTELELLLGNSLLLHWVSCILMNIGTICWFTIWFMIPCRLGMHIHIFYWTLICQLSWRWANL